MPTVIIDPIGKPRMVRSDTWKKRPAVLKYWAFKDDLKLKVGKWLMPPRVQMIFSLEMPASWSKKKKSDMKGKPHQQKPDIDNLCKSVLDCLCEDDSYIYEIRASKYWSHGKGQIYLEAI